MHSLRAAVPHPGDVDPNIQGGPNAVEWGVLPKSQSLWSVVRVVKKVGCETTFYSQPPSDAPASIVRRWAELNGAEPDYEGLRVAEAQELNARAEQEQAEEKGFLATIFSRG